MMNDRWHHFIRKLNSELQQYGLKLFDFGVGLAVTPINEEGHYLTSTAFAVYAPGQPKDTSHKIWMIEFFPISEAPNVDKAVAKIVEKFPNNAKLVVDGGRIPRWSPMRVGTPLGEVME